MRTFCAVVVAAALLWGVGEARADARPMPQNWKVWVKMGRCEQPGNGKWGIYWRHRGPTFMGGLGFYYRTWQHWKLPWYPSNAGYATWRQQMRVANRVAADVGFSAWSCWSRIR